MKLSSCIILLYVVRSSAFNVKQETSSSIYKDAIEKSVRKPLVLTPIHGPASDAVNANTAIWTGSSRAPPPYAGRRKASVAKLAGPPDYWFHPKIHAFGNTGLLGALHAAVAPLATKMIDLAAYDGENIRVKIARDLRRRVGKANANVLDLCCGVGISTRALQQAFQDAANIVGIDTSKEMIAMAKMLGTESPVMGSLGVLFPSQQTDDKHPPGSSHADATLPQYEIGNAESTSLRAGVFDLVTVMYAFHEAPYHGRYRILREARRLLSEGSTLAVVDIAPSYEPSPNMLAGEPYVLEYKKNIQTQLSKIQGFVDLSYQEIVKGHVGVWLLTRKNTNHEPTASTPEVTGNSM